MTGKCKEDRPDTLSDRDLSLLQAWRRTKPANRRGRTRVGRQALHERHGPIHRLSRQGQGGLLSPLCPATVAVGRMGCVVGGTTPTAAIAKAKSTPPNSHQSEY